MPCPMCNASDPRRCRPASWSRWTRRDRAISRPWYVTTAAGQARAYMLRVRRQTPHVAQPNEEEAPDAQRHPDHDPDRRCGGGDLGSEVTRTSTVPAMYQGPWLRARITGKL